ncbi:base non specific RNase Rh [Linnemannia elongata]|nr:base non specific RNase Rh [Linnemannia elongata]
MLSVISAVPWSVSTLSRRQDTCPLNVLSCSLREVDRCCLPEHGLLLLVQQWDITVGPRNKFTMHGIWPDTCHGGCDDNRIFFDIERRLKEYPNKADGFMQQMETFWPSNNRNNNCFWSHEWNRHGTCVSNLDPSCKSDPVEGEDIYAFFSKALELRSKYDLYQALAAKGIFPNQRAMVDITRILNAIQAAFNVTPSLSCKNGALNEITLYFKVKNGDQYVPVQPPRSNLRGNCGETVTFPPKNE